MTKKIFYKTIKTSQTLLIINTNKTQEFYFFTKVRPSTKSDSVLSHFT